MLKKIIVYTCSVVSGILLVHYLFVFFLTERITVLPVILFLFAVGLWLPMTRKLFNRIPLLSVNWLNALVVMFVLITANILLEQGNRAEIKRGNYAFINANIITGHRNAPAIPDGVVLVDDSGIISAIGAGSSISLPDDIEVIDLNGKFIMPGLINAHAHLMLIGKDRDETSEVPAIIALPTWVQDLLLSLLNSYIGERLLIRAMEKTTMSALRAGVTTVRGLGDPGFYDVKMRKRIETGKSFGPRLLVAGKILSITGGHGNQIGHVIDGPIEARKAVRYLIHNEVDLIKIANTGGIGDSKRLGEAGELQMTMEEIRAITDEAHRKGYMVAAHAESTRGVYEALLAGVDNIEHGAIFDDESIALFKNNPHSLRGYTDYHPTLSVFQGEIKLPEEMQDNPRLKIMQQNANILRDEVIEGYRTALREGVRISVGTDAGLVDHANVWRELVFFQQYGGISHQEAIYMGTLATAESIGVSDITGSLDVGKYADFMVLKADPYLDLEVLDDPEMVVMSGVIVD